MEGLFNFSTKLRLRVFLLLYVSFKEDYLQESDLCSGYMIWEKDDY
jgi:hypothetical protein